MPDRMLEWFLQVKFLGHSPDRSLPTNFQATTTQFSPIGDEFNGKFNPLCYIAPENLNRQNNKTEKS